MLKRVCAMGVGGGIVLAASIAPAPQGEMPGEPRVRQVRMELYFLEFEMSTYFPVTMQDIERAAGYVVRFLEPHPLIAKLEQLLQSRPVRGLTIDDQAIRLEVKI